MPELPGFMSNIAAKLKAASHNTMPSARDGSSTTGYDYTNGNKQIHGTKPVGHKSLPAKAGVTKVPSAGRRPKQVSRPSRKGK